MNNTAAHTVLFNTGEKANPAKLASHSLYEAWDHNVSVLVLAKDGTGTLSLILGWQDATEADLGTRRSVTADQTNRYLGEHTVVGVQTFDGRRFGNVPNRALAAKVEK